MATYVISDIHGEHEKFIKILDLIGFDKDDKLYVLGDMVDRGAKSLEVINYVMNQDNIEAILGNHEDMLTYVIDNYGLTGSLANRMIEGTHTYKTYKQLRKLWYKDRNAATQVLKFIKGLPLYKEVTVEGRSFLLVHAGIKSQNIQDNSKDDFLWIRDEFIENHEMYPFTVVFGHTPTPTFTQGPPRIYKSPNKIGIDCGASFDGGNLACLRLDDLQEFYV